MKQRSDWHRPGAKEKEKTMARLIVRKIGIRLLLLAKGILQVVLFIFYVVLSGIKIFLMMFAILARVVMAILGVASNV